MTEEKNKRVWKKAQELKEDLDRFYHKSKTCDEGRLATVEDIESAWVHAKLAELFVAIDDMEKQ